MNLRREYVRKNPEWNRTIRGGSWYGRECPHRNANRYFRGPRSRSVLIGVRLLTTRSRNEA
jgi:hypothetical protein